MDRELSRKGRYYYRPDLYVKTIPTNGWGEGIDTEEDTTPFDSEAGATFRLVEDEDLLAKLNSEPTIKTYRAMVLIDGKLYPPMSSKANGKLSEPSEIGVIHKILWCIYQV